VAAAAANHEHPLAAQLAREVVTLEPFRETGWQRLIRALAAGGNRAEALRAYAQCKKLLADELDVLPSRETEAIVRGVRGGSEPVRRTAASRRPSSRTVR